VGHLDAPHGKGSKRLKPSTAPGAYCEIDLPAAGGGRLRAVFADPADVLVARRADELGALLARVESWARQGGWALGFVAYEAAAAFDAALLTHPPVEGLPLAMFALYRDTAAAARPRGEFLTGAWRDITDRAQVDASIAAIRAGIADGDYYQVNYTTRLRAAFLGDSLGLFDALRSEQAGAWCAYLDLGRWQVCSVSPELFFHWQADEPRTLLCRPMKGTAGRDADAGRDAAAAERLRASAKDRAENLMIVDLVRNDLSRVAQLGTVRVPELFTVEAWPSVWQMTSQVACRTRAGTGLEQVFGALFPCGSITGAPKAASMAAIARCEPAPRGVYCGAIGLVQPGGAAIFSVGIRTAVVDAERGTAECGIGSGIVIDSAAEAEYAEWQSKRLFLDRACPAYELLETLRLHRGRYWLRAGHLRRLRASAQALGFAFDPARVAAALAAAAAPHGAGDWRVRLRLAADGSTATEVHPLGPPPGKATVVLAPHPVCSANPWLHHKTTRRGLYDALAPARRELYDALLYNERGELTEFTRGNLVACIDGRGLTPPLACGVLPGVYRRELVARGRVREAVLRVEDLARAQSLWFVNSVRGRIAVRLDAP